ncbi:alpha-galactosidase [Microbacterium sp. STN6]|uniref:alpha-galactosidase n=1 Tax=Microbacterium sp. STN6 TaxID=2995588 RepID=UPI0022608E9C|nr:alpha-galactosidase [Microbacterium sp. STN6]MCX7522487.1 alpha-galactosidase [Microbacterium sp. STN6]
MRSENVELVHFRAAGVSLALRLPPDGLPVVLHWGGDLGELSDEDLVALAANAGPGLQVGLDVPVEVGVVPENGRGWSGRPGLEGHRRGGAAWSPRLGDTRYRIDPVARAVAAEAVDPVAGLALSIRMRLGTSGLVAASAELTNTREDAYDLSRLCVALPVPGAASELLDLAGRWSKERVPQRRAITVGTHLRESRRGRTGADAATVLTAGTAGFGFRTGEVWGAHVGFSGNHVHALERVSEGITLLSGGELLLPGEVSLSQGERYATPEISFAYGAGLDGQAARFHAELRARERHPRSPRPVVLNTWEAVYFDHDLPTLLALADRAAEVGVERFVLDDGWFLGRRDDTAGLGDWVVDTTVWPQGLHPLVRRVREHGMQFGLWFEPEMVSPRSTLAREHPEWIMQPEGRLPFEARHQQVLNLGIDEAWQHIFDAISSLVNEYAIDFIKWDHNRDLLEAGSALTGRAAVHEQTLAVYRLMDALRAAQPSLEIESCSSGGARVDLGVLQRTDRVWASDCIDPLERQQILRWSAQLLPPELVGSHIGAPTSHTTGRTHDLSFRAATALFGHLGIEWDIASATDEERRELAEWIALYKRLRPLLHTGTVVRVDEPGDELFVSGIVAPERDEALFSFAMLARPGSWPPGLARIPGLDAQRRYRVRVVGGSTPLALDGAAPAWCSGEGIVLTGRTLAEAGLPVPPLRAEHAALAHLRALD